MKLNTENFKHTTDLGNNANRMLAAVPTNEEIMKAIHTADIVEPKDGFENAFMDSKFVAGFLTAVKWMSERHSS